MIPKIIHYCWFGGNPLPELAQKCIASWKKYCPDYEIIEWNESNFDISSVDFMREAYEEKVWGFVPDVARLQIILNNGGIYLDTDVEVVRPLDDLLNNKVFAGIENNYDKNYIALGLGFGAEKGSEFLIKLLEQYEDIHFRNSDGTLNNIPAPTMQDDIMSAMGFNGKNESQKICRGTVYIYSSEYFCPMSPYTGILNMTENTYSIHHYMGSWLSEDDANFTAEQRRIFLKYGDGLKANFFVALLMVKFKIKTVGIKDTFILICKKCISLITEKKSGH